MHVELITLLVEDYDAALHFYVDRLGFELVEDSPTDPGRAASKRWIVVRPAHAVTGFLLARADDDRQAAATGNQTGGRVGFFLRVDDFDETFQRLSEAGVTFVSPVRHEPYGSVAVFEDVSGNRWDLLGPTPE